MEIERSQSLQKSLFHVPLQRYSMYIVFGVFVIGIAALAGWQFDLEFLKRPIPRLVAMNPVTAVGFMLSGTAFAFMFMALC